MVRGIGLASILCFGKVQMVEASMDRGIFGLQHHDRSACRRVGSVRHRAPRRTFAANGRLGTLESGVRLHSTTSRIARRHTLDRRGVDLVPPDAVGDRHTGVYSGWPTAA